MDSGYGFYAYELCVAAVVEVKHLIEGDRGLRCSRHTDLCAACLRKDAERLLIAVTREEGALLRIAHCHAETCSDITCEICDVSIGGADSFDYFKPLCAQMFPNEQAENESLYSFHAGTDPLNEQLPAADHYSWSEDGSLIDLTAYIMDVIEFLPKGRNDVMYGIASHSAEDISVLCDSVCEMDKGVLTVLYTVTDNESRA